jgi:NAD(P)-dependent dehydrogenase (short-subunit alcohol dehydrogenase family)
MAYSTSKTALNAITLHYARALEATSIKVNGAAPGHVATNFSVFTGKLTAEQGAAVAIRLAQLDSNGPTSLVFEDDHRLAWELHCLWRPSEGYVSWLLISATGPNTRTELAP